MNSNSHTANETPRTDEHEANTQGSPLEANHAWSLARQLERELAEAQDIAAELITERARRSFEDRMSAASETRRTVEDCCEPSNADLGLSAPCVERPSEESVKLAKSVMRHVGDISHLTSGMAAECLAREILRLDDKHGELVTLLRHEAEHGLYVTKVAAGLMRRAADALSAPSAIVAPGFFCEGEQLRSTLKCEKQCYDCRTAVDESEASISAVTETDATQSGLWKFAQWVSSVTTGRAHGLAVAVCQGMTWDEAVAHCEKIGASPESRFFGETAPAEVEPYKDFCLRLNIARIAMNHDAICKVLDEIDSHFHRQQGGH